MAAARPRAQCWRRPGIAVRRTKKWAAQSLESHRTICGRAPHRPKCGAEPAIACDERNAVHLGPSGSGRPPPPQNHKMPTSQRTLYCPAACSRSAPASATPQASSSLPSARCSSSSASPVPSTACTAIETQACCTESNTSRKKPPGLPRASCCAAYLQVLQHQRGHGRVLALLGQGDGSGQRAFTRLQSTHAHRGRAAVRRLVGGVSITSAAAVQWSSPQPPAPSHQPPAPAPLPPARSCCCC